MIQTMPSMNDVTLMYWNDHGLSVQDGEKQPSRMWWMPTSLHSMIHCYTAFLGGIKNTDMKKKKN